MNVFYQSTGHWGKALETAEMYDRVHLRTTYYNYAKHLEAKGDINGAIPKYVSDAVTVVSVVYMLHCTYWLEILDFITVTRDEKQRFELLLAAMAMTNSCISQCYDHG